MLSVWEVAKSQIIDGFWTNIIYDVRVEISSEEQARIIK